MTRSFFTDIHSHFVFGIDDGAANAEQSWQMLEQAVACNIGQLLATPHITDLTNPDLLERLQRHFQQLREQISLKALPLQIFLGAELFYNDRIFGWLEFPWATLNNNRLYFLFELPLFDLPDRVSDFIFQSRLKGYFPILAHPERYIYLQKNIKQLLAWHQQGCLMQMNAGSLTGQFGREVETLTKRLLEAHFFSFVASDAHNSEGRSFKVLEKAYEIAKGIISIEKANDLFIANPDHAVKGLPVIQDPLIEEALERTWLNSFLNSLRKLKTSISTS